MNNSHAVLSKDGLLRIHNNTWLSEVPSTPHSTPTQLAELCLARKISHLWIMDGSEPMPEASHDEWTIKAYQRNRKTALVSVWKRGAGKQNVNIIFPHHTAWWGTEKAPGWMYGAGPHDVLIVLRYLEQVMAVSHQPQTKAEIIEYYRETYKGRGKEGWKQKLVNDLASITGIKPKNLERRFDPSRINNIEKRNASQYKQLGDTLPPIPPDGGYHIYGVIWVKYSEECEEREIDEYITGKAARRLARMAASESDGLLQAVNNAYQSQEGDIDFKGPQPCAEPDLRVEAIE